MSDGMRRELVYLSSHATYRYFIPNWGKRLYKNIHVVQLKKRLLGSKFLKRFDRVFWDSKNLTVYMWNENDEY